MPLVEDGYLFSRLRINSIFNINWFKTEKVNKCLFETGCWTPSCKLKLKQYKKLNRDKQNGFSYFSPSYLFLE